MLVGAGLEVEGEVEHSAEEGLWVAVIDWEAIRDEKAPTSKATERPDKSAA